MTLLEEELQEFPSPSKVDQTRATDKPKPVSTPPRSRSPSPIQNPSGREHQNIQLTYVLNEIKQILRHPIARKAFFEFYRSINQIDLLHFWFDVALLNNDDATSDAEVFSFIERINSKYFADHATNPLAIYSDSLQNMFLKEWITNQLNAKRNTLMKRTFYNHVQSTTALKLFELAVVYRFPEYLSLWQNVKRSEQSKKGSKEVAKKPTKCNKTDSSVDITSLATNHLSLVIVELDILSLA